MILNIPEQRPGIQTAAPNPKRPAAPNAIGVIDSPILQGQQPDQVPVPVPTQPTKRRALSWWEADWAATARGTKTRDSKQEVISEDIGKSAPPAVTEMNYANVIDPDNRQLGLQGPQLRTSMTNREGAPELREYITTSQKDFPNIRLEGVYCTVVPVNPREAVAVGFKQFGPLTPYSDVKTLYK